MIASFSVFIAHIVTSIINQFKHYLCIIGKSREENRVQIVCKKPSVQTLCKPNSPRILCKLVQRHPDRLCACISVWFGRGASGFTGKVN